MLETRFGLFSPPDIPIDLVWQNPAASQAENSDSSTSLRQALQHPDSRAGHGPPATEFRLTTGSRAGCTCSDWNDSQISDSRSSHCVFLLQDMLGVPLSRGMILVFRMQSHRSERPSRHLPAGRPQRIDKRRAAKNQRNSPSCQSGPECEKHRIPRMRGWPPPIPPSEYSTKQDPGVKSRRRSLNGPFHRSDLILQQTNN
jgi:hypothetical protein